MNKTILLSAVAAAALLAGCRTTQTNHVRRGALAGSDSGRRSRVARPATPAKPAAAQPAVQPDAPAVVERPLGDERPVVAQPQPDVRTAPVRDGWTGGYVDPKAEVPMWTQPPATPAAPAYETYVVKSGDVAGRIANSHGMTLNAFLEANGMTLEQAGKLRVGQTVKVLSGAAPLAAGPAVRPVAPAVSSDPDVYVVQPGDTLSGISAKTDVPVATLMALNGIDNPNEIRSGKALRLKAKAGGTVTPTTTQPPRVVPTTTQPPRVVPTTTQPPRVVPTTTQPVRVVPTTTQPVRVVPTTTQPVRIAPPPTTQPQQDAAVPLDQVKIAGTDASLQDILDGGSLVAAREAAAEKAEAAEKAVRQAAETASDAGAAPNGYRYYTVKEGDNIYKLVAHFKVPVTTLREINQLPPDVTKFAPGTRLLVPDSSTPAP